MLVMFTLFYAYMYTWKKLWLCLQFESRHMFQNVYRLDC